MKSEAIAFGVAGILFGLIAGWIIGSQQAGRRQPLAAPPAAPPPRRPRAAARRPPPLDEAKVTAFQSVAEREPTNADAARRSSAISTSTPSATTMRSSGTSEALKLTPNDVDVSTDLGVTLLLHEPAGRGARSSSSARSRSIRSTPRRC